MLGKSTASVVTKEADVHAEQQTKTTNSRAEIVFGTTEWQTAKDKATLQVIQRDCSTAVHNSFAQLQTAEAVVAHTPPPDKGEGGSSSTV